MAAADIANAIQALHRQVRYKRYTPEKDFDTWFAGLTEAVAASINDPQPANIQAAILRELPAKLTPGSALEAYRRLPQATLNDYDLLIPALRKAFLDPIEKNKFLNSKDFVKRKKNMKLQDYKQEVKKSVEKYALITIADTDIRAREQEKEGVQRFIAGMRRIDGKRDQDFLDNLNYYVHDEADMM